MKNLIEILPNIYGVKVPKQMNYEVHGNRLEYFIGTEFGCMFLSNNSKDKFKELGYLTKDEISFDASDVVKICKYNNEDYYPNYKEEDFSCNNLEQSLRSALPKEIFFENPLNEKEHTFGNIKSIQYQTAQENITHKLLILKKL